jgi:hypothetical protein
MSHVRGSMKVQLPPWGQQMAELESSKLEGQLLVARGGNEAAKNVAREEVFALLR